MNFIRKKISTHKVLIENFSYLSVLQLFSMLFPLITYPYLLRIIGLELYGVIVFAQVIVFNIAIIINYGFNLSGTHAIACNQENPKKISEVVSSIYIIKSSLWFICLIIYTGVVLLFPYFREHRILFIITFFLTLNDVLLPVWYFQGIEKMKYITFINLGVRLFFILLIFVLVRNKTDYIYVPTLNSLGALLGGISALIIIFRRKNVEFYFPQFYIIKNYLKNSTPFFISALSINVYTNINKLVVGVFLGMTEITIYDMAEKVSMILKLPASMVVQASFPKISRERRLRFVNKLMFIVLGFIIVVYGVVFLGADKIVYLLTGNSMLSAVPIIRIISLTAIFSTFNSFMGTNRLVAWGYKNYYMKVATGASVVFLLVLSSLYIFNIINLYTLSFLPVSVEIIISLSYLIIISRLKLL